MHHVPNGPDKSQNFGVKLSKANSDLIKYFVMEGKE
jgi:hypothetical protein